MAGIFPMGDMAIDQKKGAASMNNFAAESWLEPLLLKSDFYRKHFTSDGRRESKSTRRGSTIEEDVMVRRASMAASRKSSVAVPAAPETDGTAPTQPAASLPQTHGRVGTNQGGVWVGIARGNNGVAAYPERFSKEAI
ncbi:hypothetical protein DV737_g105, partial [Chaetothyriales sp. CBS 132003]